MKNEDQEYATSKRIMGSIIQHYLEGKLETEIAALLKIEDTEVRYVLSVESKNSIISTFEAPVWQAIQSQKEKNQTALQTAYQTPFLYMNEENLRQINNSVRLNCKNILEYCKINAINETLFSLYLTNQDYLISKLGRVKGLTYYKQMQQLFCENSIFQACEEKEKQEELFRLSVLYLDSLYTKEEFLKNTKMEKERVEYFLENKEVITSLGNETLYNCLQAHKKEVSIIRKTGLPKGYRWIKDAHLRRIIVPDVIYATPKELADLSVILSYFEHKGNISSVLMDQMRNQKEMMKIFDAIPQYATKIQPYVYQKIQLLREVQKHNLTGLNFAIENKSTKINYEEEAEQKIEWLNVLCSLGNIRPYWLCGQLAIHNFSYTETALDLGIDEAEIELASLSHMHSLTTASNGRPFPFQLSYKILQYASTLSLEKNIEKQPKKKE